MRLIDADATIKTYCKNSCMMGADNPTVPCAVPCEEVQAMLDAPTIAAPRWVKCEEPPKEDGWYMLCYLSRWKNGSWWIPDYPDYWVEPPKEDA